jgi:hypothetical protein
LYAEAVAIQVERADLNLTQQLIEAPTAGEADVGLSRADQVAIGKAKRHRSDGKLPLSGRLPDPMSGTLGRRAIGAEEATAIVGERHQRRSAAFSWSWASQEPRAVKHAGIDI